MKELADKIRAWADSLESENSVIREETVEQMRCYADQLGNSPSQEELLDIIEGLTRSTKVLAAGIGKLALPDGFVMVWNEAESRATRILKRLRP